MKYICAIALAVARNRSLPTAPSIPADYGEVLTILQKELGLSDRDLARRAGYRGGPKEQVMYRLRTGTGSVKSAIAVRSVLVKLGKAVPPVPVPGSEVARGAGGGEPWLEEWVALGRRLHDNASDEQFSEYIIGLRGLVDAMERVARQMAAISRPLPGDFPRRSD